MSDTPSTQVQQAAVFIAAAARREMADRAEPPILPVSKFLIWLICLPHVLCSIITVAYTFGPFAPPGPGIRYVFMGTYIFFIPWFYLGCNAYVIRKEVKERERRNIQQYLEQHGTYPSRPSVLQQQGHMIGAIDFPETEYDLSTYVASVGLSLREENDRYIEGYEELRAEWVIQRHRLEKAIEMNNALRRRVWRLERQ